MRGASRIGAVFGMDPIVVLEEPDRFRRAIRDASWQVFIEDQKAFFEVNGNG